MIGKVVIFAAFASCAVAVPFGNCGPWENQPLGNLLPAPSSCNILPAPASCNVLPSGLNFPAPAPLDLPAFPAGNIISPANNIITPGCGNALPPFPAPTVVPRIPAPTIQIQNLPNLPAPILPPPVQGPLVHNIEARLPTVLPRITAPAIHTRVPSFEPLFPPCPFPTVQPQIFPAPSCGPNPFPC